MANSSIIRKAKNKIVKEFIKDPEIIAAINSSEVKPNEPEKLINKHINDYTMNKLSDRLNRLSASATLAMSQKTLDSYPSTTTIYGDIFDNVYIGLTKAGEDSGEMDKTLERVIALLKKQEALIPNSMSI